MKHRQRKVTVSVVMPEDFHRELKLKAALEGLSLSSFMERLLRMGLKEYERKNLARIPAEKLKELAGSLNPEEDSDG